MNAGYVIRLLGMHGERLAPYPIWLESFNVDAYEGLGEARATVEKANALRFADQSAAFAAWHTQSTLQPLRTDGEPNRPLTAFDVEIEPA